MRDTQFWVPEVYNAIVQPSPTIRKTSRLQSTLDREIYSKAHDTSYLQAADHEVIFERFFDYSSITLYLDWKGIPSPEQNLSQAAFTYSKLTIEPLE